MPLLVVSSVGTSLVTNVMRPADRGVFFKLSNSTATGLTPNQLAEIDAAFAASRAALADASDAIVKAQSAELNGILSLIEELPPAQRNGMHHVLVATDTYAGRSAAELVGDWLRARGGSVQVIAPSGLRTDNLHSFRVALGDLVQELLPLIEDYRENRYEIVFNLTGGFKGIPGFLQSVANVTGSESVYVFEGAKVLMRIPRLPIRLASDTIIGENLALFRHLAAGFDVGEEQVKAAGIPETLLFLVDGRATLSEWGSVLWHSAWSELASRQLLPPRTSQIAYSKRFEHEIRRVTGERCRDVNTAVEALQRRFESNAKGKLAAFEFKPLNGNPVPPSTHELYAWSGRGTGRIFLHQTDEGIWVADQLGVHLD